MSKVQVHIDNGGNYCGLIHELILHIIILVLKEIERLEGEKNNFS